jgi:hypothetical protein
VLQAGESAPRDAVVWTTPRERASVAELVADGPVLLVFYLFDWSST